MPVQGTYTGLCCCSLQKRTVGPPILFVPFAKPVMEDDLRECWQSAAALALRWDELRSARVVATHEALQHAQQMAKLADDRLRSVR